MPEIDQLVKQLVATNDAAQRRELVISAASNDLAGTLGALTRTDTSDATRIAILDALVPTLTPGQLLLLVRAGGGQRPAVAEHLGELLARRQEPEAALVLRTVVAPRAPAAQERLEREAQRIITSASAAEVLDGSTGDRSVIRPGELGAVSVASDPALLVGVRGRDDSDLRVALADDLELLDDQVRSAGTAEGARRLRSALYATVLATGVPESGDLVDRAQEWLFRHDDLDAIRELAPHLPASALQQYIERALSRANRRGDREDRAELALELLRTTAPDDVRRDARPLAAECLDEDRIPLRRAAILALVGDADGLSQDLRERITAAYASLPEDERAAIAGDVRLLESETSRLNDEALIEWARSAPDEDVSIRLAALLGRWRGSAPEAEAAERFVVVAGELAERVDDAHREVAIDELITVACRWLRRQGARLAPAFAALRTWPAFQHEAALRLPQLVAELRADQARRLVSDLARNGGETIAALVETGLDDEAAVRLLIPQLAQSAARADEAPGFLAAFSPTASDAAQVRLITSALGALGTVRAQVMELDAGSSGRERALLHERLETVLVALTEAEDEARGNDELLRHFASLRSSISGLLASEAPTEPSERVSDWRCQIAERHPGLIDAPDGGRQTLAVIGDPREHGAALAELALELDQRVHNPRVLSESERADTAEDLDVIARAAIESDAELDAGSCWGPPLERPKLASLLLALWAANRPELAESRLADELCRLADPSRARQAVQRVDALAGLQASPDQLLRAAATVPTEDLAATWHGVSAALRERLKQRDQLQRRKSGQEADAMERVGDRMLPPMLAIESLLFSYFRFRALLGAAGWTPVTPSLGAIVRRERVEPADFEIQGDPRAAEFVVRSLGLRAKGEVIARAVLEPVEEAAEADPS
ncbi:MAG: hypothetical protein DYH12_02985 [Sorangiineae bacterium PRO1]|nr:hypothetical protein [Sorangiineae bacterium PRO1]